MAEYVGVEDSISSLLSMLDALRACDARSAVSSWFCGQGYTLCMSHVHGVTRWKQERPGIAMNDANHSAHICMAPQHLHARCKLPLLLIACQRVHVHVDQRVAVCYTNQA